MRGEARAAGTYSRARRTCPTVGRRQAELTRPLLDPAGRLQRRHLDLELADRRLDLLPLAAQAVELVGQVHLLHTQTGSHAEGAADQRGADEEGPDERAAARGSCS